MVMDEPEIAFLELPAAQPQPAKSAAPKEKTVKTKRV